MKIKQLSKEYVENLSKIRVLSTYYLTFRVIDKKHNYERRFICRYDSLPLTAKGTFFCKDIENEIVFVDGLWIDNSNAILDNEFRLSVIDSHMPINKKNKRAQSLLKKHKTNILLHLQ